MSEHHSAGRGELSQPLPRGIPVADRRVGENHQFGPGQIGLGEIDVVQGAEWNVVVIEGVKIFHRARDGEIESLGIDENRLPVCLLIEGDTVEQRCPVAQHKTADTRRRVGVDA